MDQHGVSAWPDDGGIAVARGNVTHAALERVAHGLGVPNTPSIVRALVTEGLDEGVASDLAPAVAAELARCLEDEFLCALLGKPQPFRAAEYQVEAYRLGAEPRDDVEDQASAAGSEILSGSMDLVVHDGDSWWVIDYKTTQPGEREDLDAFAEELAKRYAGQLRAYRQMLIEARRLDASRVKAGLYLTATQTWVEIPAAS